MDISIGLAIFGLLMFAIVLGMPIAIAMIVVSLGGIAYMRSPELAMRFLGAAANDGVSEYLFGVIPLFVLMGLFVTQSGIGRDTFDVFEWMTRRIRGGLGIATVAANTAFAAITGISIASAAVFTKVATPEMIRHGYTPKFAVGVVAGSSVIGMLLPPSLLFIVYGVQAEQSVGRLFIAGIVPGLLLSAIFIALILGMTYLTPKFIGPGACESGYSAASNPMTPIQALGKLAPIVLLILLVMGGIYSGLFSPTEAGAMGALGALILAIARRSLSLAGFWRVLVDAGNVTVSIMFLIIAATLYSRALTLSGLPVAFATMIADADLGYVQFMLLYILLLVILGFFIDSVSVLLIVVPIALPVVQHMGLDLIWFGVITVIGVEIGLLTPPFGLSVFAVKSSLSDDRISIGTIFLSTAPFVLGMLLLLVILLIFPQLTALI